MGAARIEGAVGEALSFAGETLVVVLDRAFAPGTPVRGTLTLADGELGIEGRVQGSKRTVEGRYEVRARLVNLRRTDRERLVASSGGA